jgi:hypothetical protein
MTLRFIKLELIIFKINPEYDQLNLILTSPLNMVRKGKENGGVPSLTSKSRARFRLNFHWFRFSTRGCLQNQSIFIMTTVILTKSLLYSSEFNFLHYFSLISFLNCGCENKFIETLIVFMF